MNHMKQNNDLHGYEILGLSDSNTEQQKITSYENHLAWLKQKEIEVRHEIERRITKLINNTLEKVTFLNRLTCVECNNPLTDSEIKDNSNGNICEDCLCPA